MKSIEYKGGDDAVLLIHGLYSSPLELMYVGRLISRAGYAVHIPRLPSYSFDPARPERRRFSLEEWRREVAAEFDRLRARYRTVTVGGLCIGAVLALDLAASRPDAVDGLALMATTLFYDGWSLPWTRVFLPLGFYTPLRYLVSIREHEPFGLKNEQLRQWVAREMREKKTSAAGAAALPMSAIYEAHRAMRSVRRDLPRITCPTLVLHATEDDVASVRSANFVAERIGARHVHKVLFTESYHMLSLDNEKEAVAGEISAFLAGLLAGEAALQKLAQRAPATVSELS